MDPNDQETEVSEEDTEQLSFGNGGWVRWRSTRMTGGAYIRVAEGDDVMVVTEIFLDGDGEQLDTDSLRAIPLGRIKEWINTPEVAENVRRKLHIPGPQLSIAASYFATTPGPKRNDWVAGMLKPEHSAKRASPPRPLARTRMTRPSGRLRTFDREAWQRDEPQSEAFYEELASVYMELKTRVHRAKPVIVEANDVPLRQVQTWIQKAQRDGLLPSKQARRS